MGRFRGGHEPGLSPGEARLRPLGWLGVPARENPASRPRSRSVGSASPARLAGAALAPIFIALAREVTRRSARRAARATEVVTTRTGSVRTRRRTLAERARRLAAAIGWRRALAVCGRLLVAAAVVTAADVARGESVASDRGRTFLPGGGQAPPAPEPDEPPPRATTAEEEREEPPTEEPTTVEEPAEPPPPPTTTEPAPESGETAP